MSDSEVSTSIPSDTTIEKTLRDIIGRTFHSGNHDDLTIKRVRKAVEDTLELPDSFFRGSDEWKNRSKDLITNEVERLEKEKEEAEQKPKNVEKKPAPKTNGKPTTAPKRKAEPPSKRGTKRAISDAKTKAKKKRRVSSDEESELSALSSIPPEGEHEAEEEDDSEAESTPPPVTKVAKPRAKPAKSAVNKPAARKSRAVKRKAVDSDREDEDEKEESLAPKKAKVSDSKDEDTVPSKAESEPLEDVVQPAALMVAPKEKTKDDASESEMSVVIDEPPKKKRQKKAQGEKPTKAPTPAKKAKEAAEVSPDDSEIKRLQGWLVKCGIRKLWGVELKPYDTPKAKIQHLKSMLSDAGMDGRYSIEKAKKIKERRELVAELEAVEEFGARWGEDKRASRGATRGNKVRKVISDDEDEEEEERESSDEEGKQPKAISNQWGIDADLLGGDGSDSD